MDLRRRVKGEKVYRGAYKYLKGETVYCEEEFEVYKDRKELNLSFFAELHSRVATGELLTTYVDFQISKDYVPIKVLVEKTLGKEVVKEIYDFNKRTNVIDYLFISKKGEQHCQITTNPKFGIQTPAACTSMLFLRSKKEDTTAKNYFNIITSFNHWKFENEPSQQTIVLERAGSSQESMLIEGQSVQAIQYKMYNAEELSEAENQNLVEISKSYVSKHATIPYLVKSDDGIKIQIKYLNDLDKDH